MTFTQTPPVTTKTKTIVLLSGGLDSTTSLAVACNRGHEVHALTVDYGQRNRFELKAASKIAHCFKVAEHKLITIDLRIFGGSSLTSSLPVERNRERSAIGNHVPSSYVPARNTILLSYALAWADVLEIENIFIGINAVDAGGYPDCRPEFVSAFENLANVATRIATEGSASIRIHTPLIDLSKADIIRLGTKLGVDYSMTNTCYDPTPDEGPCEGRPCGTCDSCIIRQHGFFDAGMIDPLPYITPLPSPNKLKPEQTTT